MKYSFTFICFLSLLLYSCNETPKKNDVAKSESKNEVAGKTTVSEGLNVDKDSIKDSPLKLVPYRVHLEKGLDFKLNIPEGYELLIASEGMKRLRFLCPAPDGRLFATDMHDLTDNKKGKIYIFDGWDESLGRFRKRSIYLENLHNPNQVAFYNYKGKDYLYVATTGKLLRYLFHKGDVAPSAAPRTIDTFPTYGLNYKYGGWHLTRSLAFHNGKLYVAVGSSCNACIEHEDVRATILEMEPDGSQRHIYAKGLRNCVAIKWIKDDFFATGMGQDKLGADRPDDLFQDIKPGINYGWPYYYQYNNKIYADDSFAADRVKNSTPGPPLAYMGLGAHVAPLGFDYMNNFNDPALNNYFLLALHGSSIINLKKGYAIVRIKKGAETEKVIDGFLQGGDRYARPCDVLMHSPESFFFTDDLNGVLYFVRKKK